MKKLLLVFLILAVGILPLVGCEGFSSGGSGLDTPTPTPAPVPAPEPEFPIPKVDNNSEEVETILPGKPPPDDMTWISPGKVMVGNFYPGARAEYPLTIHNGNDTRTEFSVYYRYPDHVGEDYIKATEEVQDWVIVVDPTPVLAPRETIDILVVLDMPEGAESPGPKWEFWIGVRDTTQTGMVQTELACRWLVTMR